MWDKYLGRKSTLANERIKRCFLIGKPSTILDFGLNGFSAHGVPLKVEFEVVRETCKIVS